MGERVTLISPDGRRYTTDDAAEVNALVGGHGYQRVSEDQSAGGDTEAEQAEQDERGEQSGGRRRSRRSSEQESYQNGTEDSDDR